MNIPSNYVVGRLKKICDKDIIFSNYPDGIAQFYNPQIEFINSGLNFYEVIKRFSLGLISGVYYKPDFRPLFSQYEPLDKIYSYSKSLIDNNYKDKVKIINYKKKNIKGNNLMLVANSDLYDNNFISNFLENMDNYSMHYDSIFYKPHPSKKEDKFADFIKSNNNKIVIINKDSILETVFNNKNCSTLISIGTFSSSLINLRLIYGERVKLILFDPLQNSQDVLSGTQRKLCEIMDHYNIIIVARNNLEMLVNVVIHD